jgi:hypothetical protein
MMDSDKTGMMNPCIVLNLFFEIEFSPTKTAFNLFAQLTP